MGTSAKTGLGLQDVFQAIADQVIDKSPAPGIVLCLHKPSDFVVASACIMLRKDVQTIENPFPSEPGSRRNGELSFLERTGCLSSLSV